VGDLVPADGGIELDVRSAAAWEAAVAWTLRQHGGLDILVNNAALTVRRPFFEIDEAEWDDVLAVNLRGVFLGCQIAGGIMRDRGWGRIVNLSSLAGQRKADGMPRTISNPEGDPGREPHRCRDGLALPELPVEIELVVSLP
jgi:NAD(P)-dependent dehydrogenase (short-subunit alcohol dehydrogenase family)